MSDSSESTEWVIATDTKEDNEVEEEVTGPPPAETVEGQGDPQHDENLHIPSDGKPFSSPAQPSSSSLPANGLDFVTGRNRYKEPNPGIGEMEKRQDTGNGNPQDKKNKEIEDIADRALKKMMKTKGRDKDRPNGKKKSRSHTTPSKNKKSQPTTKRGFR